MKKELGLLFLILSSLGFVSAYTYSGGYSSFDFGGLFSSFSIANMMQAVFFIIVFTALYWASGRTPLYDSTITRWILSIGISLFALWWTVSSGFSFENLVSQLGIPTDLLSTILWMVAAIISIILIWKFHFRNFLAIVFGLAGVILVGLSIFQVLQKWGAGMVIGGIFILIALILNRWEARRRLYRGMSIKDRTDYKVKRRDLRRGRIEFGKKAAKGAWKVGTYPVKKVYNVGKEKGWFKKNKKNSGGNYYYSNSSA